MSKISFCIILYNKALSESKTIKTLTKCFEIHNFNGEIVVFNNGPKIIYNNHPNLIVLHNILINASLSKIYNKFIEEYNSDFYVFLDDDTSVTAEYLNEIINNRYNILFPKIYCNDLQYYPILKGKKIFTVTSGICLSSYICKYIAKENGTTFDERLDLYGIDFALCYYINKENLIYKVSESQIDHDLSMITSSSTKRFREIEILISNCASLIPYFSFKLFIIVLIGQLKMLSQLEFKVFLSGLYSILLRRTIRLWKF